MNEKLFRDAEGGAIKEILNPVEGASYQDSPLDFFIMLARYKFAARHVRRNHTVFDIGCGQGLGSVFLSKFAGNVVGMDYDDEMIQRNSTAYPTFPTVTFKRLNLLEPLAEPGLGDVVVSMDVIEHFTQEEQELVTASYAGLLKENGFAVIGTPSIVSSPYASERRRMSHKKELSPDEFEALMRRHFKQVFLFSMTDETVSTSFAKLAWYLLAIGTV